MLGTFTCLLTSVFLKVPDQVSALHLGSDKQLLTNTTSDLGLLLGLLDCGALFKNHLRGLSEICTGLV
jgi:hypothetical protein